MMGKKKPFKNSLHKRVSEVAAPQPDYPIEITQEEEEECSKS